MWEKISKVSVQNIIAVVLVVGLMCFGIMVFIKCVPENNKDLANFFLGQLFGIASMAMGWLYTTNKHNQSQPKP